MFMRFIKAIISYMRGMKLDGGSQEKKYCPPCTQNLNPELCNNKNINYFINKKKQHTT